MTLDELARVVYESRATSLYLPFGWDGAPGTETDKRVKERCRNVARAVVLALEDDLRCVLDWSCEVIAAEGHGHDLAAHERLRALIAEAESAGSPDR